MLQPIVYRLLSNGSTADAFTVRIFMYLMSEYDLREFTVIQVVPIAAHYHCNSSSIKESIDKLRELGILERGPHVAGNIKTAPTYRIRRQFLLSDAALKRHYQDLRERDERAMLLT